MTTRIGPEQPQLWRESWWRELSQMRRNSPSKLPFKQIVCLICVCLLDWFPALIPSQRIPLLLGSLCFPYFPNPGLVCSQFLQTQCPSSPSGFAAGTNPVLSHTISLPQPLSLSKWFSFSYRTSHKHKIRVELIPSCKKNFLKNQIAWLESKDQDRFKKKGRVFHLFLSSGGFGLFSMRVNYL